MKALSVRQPYATLICTPREDNPLLGIKDIENRTTRTHFRGRIYIHASAKWHDRTKSNDVRDLLTWEQRRAIPHQTHGLFIDQGVIVKDHEIPLSAIIGEVDIIDCVINHPSIWAEHQIKEPIIDDFTILDNGIEHTDEDSFNQAVLLYQSTKPIWNWVLANPVLYEKPILNVKGKLSFWNFRDLKECRCCTNKETDEEMRICVRCEQEYCSYCQAEFNQFSQIDYDCCQDCANRDDRD
jgi:hypothetical protein